MFSHHRLFSTMRLRGAILGVVLVVGVLPSAVHAGIIGLGQASNFAVLGFNNLTVNTENDGTTINGNMGLSSGDHGDLKKGTLNGNLLVNSGSTFTLGGSFIMNGSILTGQNLSPAVSDAINASAMNAALVPTQILASLTNNTTITGNGGQNVISTPSINLQNKSFTLHGGANDIFLFNVAGDLHMSSVSFTLDPAITANHILFNVLGTGASNINSDPKISVELLNGAMTAYGTYLARNGDIFVDHPTVNGAIIGGFQDISTNTAAIRIQSVAIVNGAPFTPPVPEPSTLVLLALGGCGALVWRRAKRERWGLTSHPAGRNEGADE